MSIAYLPNVAPANNNTQQIRRRTNDLVSTVNDAIGSIAGNNGDIGTLANEIAANTTDIATINTTLATGITGTVALAKLTTGGTNGSLTFTKGLITAFTAPT
jgi:hypothetical protein